MHVLSSYLYISILASLLTSENADISKQTELIGDCCLIVTSGAVQKNPYWIHCSVQDIKFIFRNIWNLIKKKKKKM